MTHTFKVQTTQFTVQSTTKMIDVQNQCDKKPRKPTLKAEKRNYPRRVDLSTAEYVQQYYELNKIAHGSPDIGAFFHPLSTRITPVEGEDSYAVDD